VQQQPAGQLQNFISECHHVWLTEMIKISKSYLDELAAAAVQLHPREQQQPARHIHSKLR
jgi:hypothetical protein